MSDSSLTLPGDDPYAPHLVAAMAFLAGLTSRATRTGYARDLREWFTWCGQNRVNPMRATRPHVQVWATHLTEDLHLAPATVARRVTAVGSFYRMLELDGTITRTPVLGIKTPKIVNDPTTRVVLNRYQLANLLRVAKVSRNPCHWMLIELLSTLAMRVTEACSIDIGDITTTPEGYRAVRTIAKGERPMLRAIPIPSLAALDAAVGDRTSGPLILRPNGTRMTRHGAWDVIQRLGRRAGIDRIHPHALRRTHATLLLDAGVPIEVVQDELGHADLRMTKRYHAHPIPMHGQSSHMLAAMVASSG